MSANANPAVEQILTAIAAAALPSRDGRSYRLSLGELKPVPRRAGWFYVALGLGAEAAGPSRTPLAAGIVSGGGRRVMPWMELRVYPTVELADGTHLDARAAGLEAAFIDRVGQVIPRGGHLMIEYESPGQSDTHAELLLRVPPAATYLGALMFQAGFRGPFKDWYISEGAHEGPRKLQANKSPTAAAERAALTDHRAELTRFVRRPLPEDRAARELVARAQDRARRLLQEIKREAAARPQGYSRR